MSTSVQANTFTLGTICVTALLVPYLFAAVRKRYAGASLPVRAYGPHLMFLCIVRFIPMFKAGSPQPVASWVAFGQVLALWAGAVMASEWIRNRRLRVRGRDV